MQQPKGSAPPPFDDVSTVELLVGFNVGFDVDFCSRRFLVGFDVLTPVPPLLPAVVGLDVLRTDVWLTVGCLVGFDVLTPVPPLLPTVVGLDVLRTDVWLTVLGFFDDFDVGACVCGLWSHARRHLEEILVHATAPRILCIPQTEGLATLQATCK